MTRLDVITENIIRLEPFNTFRGIFDALELDLPLLEVKVCMIADKPIARATSIPKSDFDGVLNAFVLILAHFNVQIPWYTSSLLARRPHLTWQVRPLHKHKFRRIP
jgi:hypothetical protein